MEIERKFTVTAPPRGLDSFRHVCIRQCYLSFGGDTPERRIRKMSDGKGDRYFLTEKGSGTLCRIEDEREISREEYLDLSLKAQTGDLEKTRYYIPLDGTLTAELDVYGGTLSGLITVEVEFDSEESAAKFTPPSWFGKDVTEDSTFKNKCLARFGIPTEYK